jgi:hypothetical protein
LIKRFIENITLPKPKEQANNLLKWIGDNLSSKPNAETDIPLNNLISLIGCYDEEGVKYVADYLKEEALIIHRGFASTTTSDGVRRPPRDLLRATMTFDGWDYYEKLLQTTPDSKAVFMAMDFDPKFTTFFNETLKPAVKETGFELFRVDEVPRAGIIDNLIRAEIRRSKFIIADLTNDNRGAYWEAGFAEGLGKEVIYICEKSRFDDKGNPIHFDTNHCQTVPFDLGNLADFTVQLKSTIRTTFPAEAKME